MTTFFDIKVKVKEKNDSKRWETIDHIKDLDEINLIEYIDKYINLGVNLNGKKKRTRDNG